MMTPGKFTAMRTYACLGLKEQRSLCSRVGPLKLGPHGAMTDWPAVFTTLPGEFTLDALSARETAGEKPRAYLRQMAARWPKEGRVGVYPEDSKHQGNRMCRRAHRRMRFL